MTAMIVNLAELARATGSRRKSVKMRPIIPTGVLASDLFAIYLDSLNIWRAAARAIVNAYVEPSPVTTDADGSQIQWLVAQAARDAENTVFTQTEKLGRWVARVGTWNGAKTIAAAKSALGVDIAPFIRLSDVSELIEESIRQNVALIRKVNADTRASVEAILYDAITNRRSKKHITDELAKALAITKKRARSIANDQMHKLNIALTAYRNEQLGIKTYIWVTRHDDRVRPAHRSRDGNVFSWSEPPWDGHPGFAINCRCVAAPVVEI